MSLLERLTKPVRLGSATMVVGHLADKRVRYRAEDAERLFGSVVGGMAKATNVDKDAPAEVPRLSMRQGAKVLTLANSRVQLVMSFQEAPVEVTDAFKIVEKNARLAFEAILNYQLESNLRDIGLIIELGYPTDIPTPEIFAELARKLYAGPRLGNVVSLELRIGFESGEGLYTNLGFSVYEARHGKFIATGQAQIHIDVNSLPIQEVGVGVTIDVNNRPSASMDGYRPKDSFDAVLAEASNLVLYGHRQFLLD